MSKKLKEEKDVVDIQNDSVDVQSDDTISNEISIETKLSQVLEPPSDTKSDKKWYIMKVISGSENSIKLAIEHQAKSEGLGDMIEQVLVPSVEVTIMRTGKQVKIQKRLLPGYMIIKMNPIDSVWNFLSSIKGASGSFLKGGNRKPAEVSEKEIFAILKQVKKIESTPVQRIQTFEIGEKVKISEGPFETFFGSIEDVDIEKSRLRVSVSIFGRPTPIELGFNQVKKSDE
jgi:transcriptional antiterminator NusG